VNSGAQGIDRTERSRGVRLRNLSLQGWIQKHRRDHAEVWLREAMPWQVLAQIDFDPKMQGRDQSIEVHESSYRAQLRDTRVQDNGRICARVHIETISQERLRGEIPWRCDFSVVYESVTLEVVTVFTKGDHPLKAIVEKFILGDFAGIQMPRQGQALLVLARVLMSEVAANRYSGLEYLQRFDQIPGGVRGVRDTGTLGPYSGAAFPVLSEGRIFWLMYAWDEVVAHRYGIWFAAQCERLLIVYANPNRTRHHRCAARGVEIISLAEFIDRLPEPMRRAYDRHLWLIREGKAPPREPATLGEVYSAAERRGQRFSAEDLREAQSVFGLDICDSYDALYVMAAYNLVNAWVSWIKDRPGRFTDALFKELYSFKGRLAATLSRIVLKEINGVDIFLDCADSGCVAYIKVHGLQFSFKSVTLRGILFEYRKSDGEAPVKGDYLLEYSRSRRNIPQGWSGVRLKPVAAPLLHWARRLRNERARSLLVK